MSYFVARPYDTSQPLPPPDSSPEGPDLGPLNEAEQGWVASHVAGLADFGVDVDDLAALGAFYDEQLRQWLATSASERPDPNDVVIRIGLGLGEHIRRRADMTWVVSTDQFGSEVALHRTEGNVLIYPTNMLAKRWVAGEVGALPPLGQATVEAVHKIGRGETL